MIHVAYALYILFVIMALLRGRARLWGRSRRAWVIWSVAMVVLPALAATAVTLLITSGPDNLDTGMVIVAGYAVGAFLFIAGMALGRRRERDSGLPLRSVGWSLVAGVTLVPATIALFAPLAGLLAFFVLPREPKRHSSSALFYRQHDVAGHVP